MKRYYTYLHIDPETYEVVYVGKGCGGRAWDISRNRGGHPDHQAWMMALTEKGFIPEDWVEIKKKNLSEKDAFTEEKETLYSLGVLRFNRQTEERQHQAKITNNQALSMLLSGKQWKAVTAKARQ